MPKVKGNKLRYQQRKLASNGRFVPEEVSEDVEFDFILQGFTDDSVYQPSGTAYDEERWGSLLPWDPSKTKGKYFGTHRASVWRKNKKKAQERESNPQTGALDQYFVVAPTTTANASPESTTPIIKKTALTEEEKQLYEACRQKLYEDWVNPEMNKKAENSVVQRYRHSQFLCVFHFLRLRLAGKNKTEAAKTTADWVYPKRSQHYRPRVIVKWAKAFLEYGEIPHHQQGAHVKHESFLSDEDIRQKVLNMIRSLKAEQRSLEAVRKYVDETIAPGLLGTNVHTSLTTISRYMHEWGFVFKRHTKDVYYDGHEREDVKLYRFEWAKRMMGYLKRMEKYEEDPLTGEITVVQPTLAPGEKKLVLVTHDESTFYSNDGKTTIWTAKDENPLRKKSPGASIMVSEFLCTCHGTMKVKGWSSRTFLETGANKEGYWKSEHMIKQLTEDAIPLFEKLHPGCSALFIFDQSSNHQAFGHDALIASRMNLKDRLVKKKEEFHFRDTVWVDRHNEEHQQSFYYDKVVKTHNAKKGTTTYHTERWLKGIRTILTERGRYHNHTLNPDTPASETWKLWCGNTLPSCPKSYCCARHHLESQPDFMDQKSAIHTAIRTPTEKNDGDHICEMYAKFSPETNFIERYWSAAKRIARVCCSYTFAGLKNNLPSFLDQAGDVSQLQRYYNRCMRYVEAYSENLDGYQADDRVKKFSAEKKSHRRTL